MKIWRVVAGICFSLTVFANVAVAAAPDSKDSFQSFGDGLGFLNIAPPGQYGDLSGAQVTQTQGATNTNRENAYPDYVADQRVLYNNLAQTNDDLSDKNLSSYFKDASFGVEETNTGRTYEPHRDAIVVRDKAFGVPHIFADTKYATFFATGYTTAEDKLLVMDTLRQAGRGQLTAAQAASVTNVDIALLAPYTEEDLQRQLNDLQTSDEEGARVVAAIKAYADGVNALLRDIADQPEVWPLVYQQRDALPEKWKPTDTVAVMVWASVTFGRAGGRELTNYCGAQQLGASLGDRAKAREIFDDLHQADEENATTTTRDPFVYPNTGAIDSESVAELDCASLAATFASQLPYGGFGTQATSNAVLIAGKYTDSGNPIALFGPQVGFSMPSLLQEKDVHGPDIDVRGVGFAGADVFVQFGRGPKFAWSATSSGADNTDTFVFRLCTSEDGTEGTQTDGACEPLNSINNAGVVPNVGPVIARGQTTDAEPVIVALRRASYGKELQSMVGYARLNNPKLTSSKFRDAVAPIVEPTNWFYVGEKSIAYQHACRCPQRAPGVDLDFPTWGDERWNWEGLWKASEQPRAQDPKSGYLVSWNNKPAPGIRAADDQFGWTQAQRVDLLDRGVKELLARNEKVGAADVVRVTQDAATKDLRAVSVLPQVLELLDPETTTDTQLLTMRERLEIWNESGSYRRDQNLDGQYEEADAVAIMDAWWPLLVNTALNSPNALDFLSIPIDDPPSSNQGSAWYSGMYGQVQHELDVALDANSADWNLSYCGGIDTKERKKECRDAIWKSLSQASEILTAEFGSPTNTDWKRVPADDQIEFRSITAPLLPMDWMNRPTFQQVVQVGGFGILKENRKLTLNPAALGIAAFVGVMVFFMVFSLAERRAAKNN